MGVSMNEAITKLSSQIGVEEAKARKAAGIILAFLKKEGPPEAVQKLMNSFPEAEALIKEAEGAGGAMGAMMGAMGGGIMAVGTKLMGLGMNMSQVQQFSRATFALGRQYAGEEAMGQLVAEVPGLSQFAA
jgi:hypothetical protein